MISSGDNPGPEEPLVPARPFPFLPLLLSFLFKRIRSRALCIAVSLRSQTEQMLWS